MSFSFPWDARNCHRQDGSRVGDLPVSMRALARRALGRLASMGSSSRSFWLALVVVDAPVYRIEIRV